VLPTDCVRAAKLRVLESLSDQGLLKHGMPLEEGHTPDASSRDATNQGALNGAEAICELDAVKNLLHHTSLHELFEAIFSGRKAVTYEFKWLRAVRHGQSSGFHMDSVYMGSEAAPNVLTCWIPMMDIPSDMGGLAVFRSSNHDPGFAKVRETYGRHDLDTGDVSGTGWFSEDPVEVSDLSAIPSGRWETADFCAGDVVVFTKQTMHGSAVNRTQRWRLSFDVRWQPDDEPVDARWMKDREGNFPGVSSRWALHRNDPEVFPRTIEMAKVDWGIARKHAQRTCSPEALKP